MRNAESMSRTEIEPKRWASLSRRHISHILNHWIGIKTARMLPHFDCTFFSFFLSVCLSIHSVQSTLAHARRLRIRFFGKSKKIHCPYLCTACTGHIGNMVCKIIRFCGPWQTAIDVDFYCRTKCAQTKGNAPYCTLLRHLVRIT